MTLFHHQTVFTHTHSASSKAFDCWATAKKYLGTTLYKCVHTQSLQNLVAISQIFWSQKQAVKKTMAEICSSDSVQGLVAKMKDAYSSKWQACMEPLYIRMRILPLHWRAECSFSPGIPTPAYWTHQGWTQSSHPYSQSDAAQYEDHHQSQLQCTCGEPKTRKEHLKYSSTMCTNANIRGILTSTL